MEVLLIVAAAVGVKVFVDMVEGNRNTAETHTPDEPPLREASWYRAENERIEAAITNLVKQRELLETQRWLEERDR